MTSSLVGSEMCIRDREGGVLSILDHLLSRSSRALTESGLDSGDCRGGVAVSYTHLTLPTICSV
eukprot:6992664-Prorocentrum_lima.AAC.1